MKMSILAASAQDRFLRRTLCFSLVAAMLLVTAHRLPAPIQEVPESPTPAPTVAPTAKPKPKPLPRPKPKLSTNEVPSKEKTRTAKSAAQTTPSVPPAAGQKKVDQFAGTWTGMIESKNPLVGVGSHPATFVVNAAENSVKETGPVGTFTHPASVSGNTFTFTTGVFREITVTMKLIGDGRTGQVTVNDRIWGTCSGTMKKQN